MRFGPLRLPRDWRWLVSPAGAALALVCFFLPWGRFSCMGLHKTVSGTDLGGSFWTLVLAALAIVGLGGLLIYLGRAGFARILIALCTSYVAIFLVVKAMILSRGIATPVGHIRPPVEVSPRFGGVGLLLGFLLAGAGTALMRTGRFDSGEPESGPRPPRE